MPVSGLFVCFVQVTCIMMYYMFTRNKMQFENSAEAVTKEKSQGYLFRSVLKCIPYLIEEVGRSDKITEIIPQHGISIDPGVREEAVQVLNRIVRYLPHRRFAVMRGMANFIIRLPDEFPLLIQTSLGRLVELMRYWRVCLSDESLEYDGNDIRKVQPGSNASQRLTTFYPSVEAIEFRTSEIDAVGLIFLSSVDIQIRHTALELLRCVRALRSDLREFSINGRSDLKLRSEVEPIYIIDILEEHGVNFSLNFLWVACSLFFLVNSVVAFIFRMTLSRAAIGILAGHMT